ncbi:hypothetical protein [Actinoallomurus vinaceus]
MRQPYAFGASDLYPLRGVAPGDPTTARTGGLTARAGDLAARTGGLTTGTGELAVWAGDLTAGSGEPAI